MGIKYSMEGFIKYKKKNMVDNSKRGLTYHNVSYYDHGCQHAGSTMFMYRRV